MSAVLDTIQTITFSISVAHYNNPVPLVLYFH